MSFEVWNQNESSMNFHLFFEAAIVLPFDKNDVNQESQKFFRCHFVDSVKFSKLVSKRD